MGKEKKNGVGRGIAALFTLLLCCMSILPDLQVQAAQEDKLGIVEAYDENGDNVVSLGGAAVRNNDSVYVLADAAVCTDENNSYVYVDATGERYPLELAGTSDIGVCLMKFTDSGAGVAGVMDIAYAVQDQTANFVYYDKESGEPASVQAQFTEAKAGEEFTSADITTERTCEYISLAILVSDDGKCMGFAVGSGAYIFNDEETFYGNGSDQFPAPFIALGCIAAAGAYLYRKKKKAKDVPPVVPVQEDIPVYQDLEMEAPIEPFVEEYPPAEPVDDIPPTEPFQDKEKLFLIGTGGYMNARAYPIGQEITIGRSSSSIIRYPNEAKGVSRKHCKIYKSGGGYKLIDYGSSYGTFLKGYGRLPEQKPVEVKCGDTFYVGSKKNGFTIGQG